MISCLDGIIHIPLVKFVGDVIVSINSIVSYFSLEFSHTHIDEFND